MYPSAVAENVRKNDHDDAQLPFLSFASVVDRIKSNERKRERREMSEEVILASKVGAKIHRKRNFVGAIQKNFILARLPRQALSQPFRRYNVNVSRPYP